MIDPQETWPYDDEELDSLLASMPEEVPEGADESSFRAETGAPFAQVEAERLMRRYRALALEIVEIEKQYERDFASLAAWRERRIASRQKSMQWLEFGLASEARALADSTGGKRKKLDTAWGYVQLRKPSAKVEVTDEAAATAWLEENGLSAYVAVKKSVDKAALKKSFAADEVEEVPGVILLEPGQDTATVHPYLEQGDVTNG